MWVSRRCEGISLRRQKESVCFPTGGGGFWAKTNISFREFFTDKGELKLIICFNQLSRYLAKRWVSDERNNSIGCINLYRKWKIPYKKIKPFHSILYTMSSLILSLSSSNNAETVTRSLEYLKFTNLYSLLKSSDFLHPSRVLSILYRMH